MQRSIQNFFQPLKRQRLICKGSKHQGEIHDGGSQCCCISLLFLSSPTPTSSADVDHLLENGTSLYRKYFQHGDILIQQLEGTVKMGNKTLITSLGFPKCGSVMQRVDNNDALTVSLESAVGQVMTETNTFFLTLGNAPGSTVGVKMENGSFVVMDSHSRNDNGLCCSDGKAVVLTFGDLSDFAKYVREMAQSLSANDMQFEIIGASFNTSIEDNDLCTSNKSYANIGPVLSHSNSKHDPQGPNDERSSPEIRTRDLEREHDIPPGPSNSEPPPSTPSCASSLPLTSDKVLQNSSLPSCDIARFVNNPQLLTDEIKFSLIENRKPHTGFSFPSRSYKDKRRSCGVIHRRCNIDWFNTFNFISYSESEDALFCLSCVLFPSQSHRRPKKLITEPYYNWKDAREDLKQHSVCEYHKDSMALYHAFVKTHSYPHNRIDVSINALGDNRVQKNRSILSSIIESIIFCGRQGISLRGHRDDETCRDDAVNMGNFKELLDFRASCGDDILKDHLQSSRKNATYISKTSQNDLLSCIKGFIQAKIVDEIREQTIGPYYGFQCDEVTDASNWEQLGLVIRYVKNGKPIERLLEFIECEEITGEAICESIIAHLNNVGLDPNHCRSQTMDGAGNMAGKIKGVAARFTRQYPQAMYHYCSSHDLNLALCKSCSMKEIQLCLDALKKLGIFFKYSPKRTRRLEHAVDEVNENCAPLEQVSKKKFKVFSETRWVEKHTTLQTFEIMYLPLLRCLDAISTEENNWDSKSSVEAHGLRNKISDPLFIASYQTVSHFFGYFAGLSRKLQGSALDIVQGYKMVSDVRELITRTRLDDSEYDTIYQKMEEMAAASGVEMSIPRRCSRQTQRSNVPASTPKEYYRRSIYIPYLDSLIQQLDLRFTDLAKQTVQAMCLVPSNLCELSHDAVSAVKSRFALDMPNITSFEQELRLWRKMWSHMPDSPDTLSSTLGDKRSCRLMYPNITKIMHLMLLTSVTSGSVERANSSLRFIKSYLRTTMGEERFNALMLLFIHRDITINVEQIIDIFARKYPRRMLLANPIGD